MTAAGGPCPRPFGHAGCHWTYLGGTIGSEQPWIVKIVEVIENGDDVA